MDVEKKFNLLSEPWIVVLDDKGLQQKLPLLQVFENAHEIKCVAGELPTQDVAILRLLLAVVYAVFTRADVEGNAIAIDSLNIAQGQWKSLWEQGKFPYKQIEAYLEYYREHFYLFHPSTPFFQVPGLHTAKGETNLVTQIIADVPSRVERRFFSNRSGDRAGSLDYDEAARWLVHLQAYDYAGKKASIVDGAPNGGGTGWLGKLGLIFLKGSNLFETLLLNFVLFTNGGLVDIGRPSWEDPFLKPEKRERRPSGFVDLLTWQSRRVLLFENNEAVTGILSSYGDVFDKKNTFLEQMSGWHLESEKHDNVAGYIPNCFDKDRLLWRDLGALLPQTTEGNSSHSAGIIEWRAQLKLHNLVDNDLIHVETVGVEYGAMQGVVNELITDKIVFNAGLLTEMGSQWNPLILDALKVTDDCVKLLGDLARDLKKSAGADDKGPSVAAVGSLARAGAYYMLDHPFRAWLVSIDPELDDQDEVCLKWKETARNLIQRRGEHLIEQCAMRAFVGQTAGMNAFKASMKFKTRLYKAIPLTQRKGDQ